MPLPALGTWTQQLPEAGVGEAMAILGEGETIEHDATCSWSSLRAASVCEIHLAEQELFHILGPFFNSLLSNLA